jgi:hypothetical protein
LKIKAAEYQLKRIEDEELGMKHIKDNLTYDHITDTERKELLQKVQQRLLTIQKWRDMNIETVSVKELEAEGLNKDFIPQLIKIKEELEILQRQLKG